MHAPRAPCVSMVGGVCMYVPMLTRRGGGKACHAPITLARQTVLRDWDQQIIRLRRVLSVTLVQLAPISLRELPLPSPQFSKSFESVSVSRPIYFLRTVRCGFFNG
jgi:hypothetical protein